MLWRPKTILQLVLIGLVTVIAPLCVAIFFAVQTLDELSRENSLISERAVSLTRASQVFRSNLLDLERRARQYETLRDESLFALFLREHQQISRQLQDIDNLLRSFQTQDPEVSRAHWQLSQMLGVVPLNGELLSKNLTLFVELSDANRRFQRLVEAYVDQQLRERQLRTREIRESFLLTLLLLAVLTISSALVFSYWINKPIRQIERRIGQLGRGDLGRPISISGPQEIQALGDQLEWLRNRLNELESQKQQFLRHMSHELKTPLASLREGADLMADGIVGDLQLKQREIIEIIQDNSRELQRLIENLLDYNQFLNSRQINATSVDIRMLWQDLLASYKLSIEHKNLRIKLKGDSSEWFLDFTKIKTTLDNLLSNAVNYTPTNGRIEIDWRIDNTELHIDVANSGQPIPAEEAAKIFQPFYQGSASRSGPIKGSGIGLSVARECIEAHGGSLELLRGGRLPVHFRVRCPQLHEAAA